ncbi:MAG: calcium-binding protein [Planctomycetaceae bacterium]
MSHQRRTRRNAAATSFESLEQKVLLTAVNLLGSGELKITGTNAVDNVEVRKVGDQVKVKVQGEGTTSFDALDVSLITFRGKDGHDKFHNKTNIASEARGDAGKDTLIGGTADDVLQGNGGRDDLRGRGGNDELRGGGGHDVMKGHAGKDDMFGGGGNDNMVGGADNDNMHGNAGDDTMAGGTGKDFVGGHEGDDNLSGGKDNDWVFGYAGDDIINGNDGKDLLAGGDDDDQLNGGDDADTIYGGAGNDTLNGGGFDNAADYLQGQTGYDVFHNYEKWGGGWEDTLSDPTPWEVVHFHERFDFELPDDVFEPLDPILDIPELDVPVLDLPDLPVFPRL